MISTAAIGMAVFLAVLYFVPRLRPKEKSGRLARVRKAAFIGVALLLVYLPLGLYGFFGFLFGWHRFLSSDICRLRAVASVLALQQGCHFLRKKHHLHPGTRLLPYHQQLH